MDPWTIIVGVGVIVGIAAGIAQVMDYLEKRRERQEELSDEPDLSTPTLLLEVLHNLPPRNEFIGREAEKARVHEALQSRSYLVSIDGIGGIGKTSLALEVVHECLNASRGEESTNEIARFDGFIWTTAKDRDLTLNALLDTIVRTLDYPGIAQQPFEEKRGAVQKLLQGNPYMLIVDNFETITDDDVRAFLLNLPEPSKALITTREQKLRQAQAISLKGLTEAEALALIRNEGRRLGLTSLENAEAHVLLQLYRATGGAPLAIKWSVGQIKQKGQSLDTVLAALYEARGDLFDNIFARSWDLLLASARQVLMVMPIFATSASRAGIEAASDVHHFALDEVLGQLVEMSLIDATDELDLRHRRYSIHPLTRSFAGTHLSEDAAFELNARSRLAEYYMQRSREKGGNWGDVSGFPWFETELSNIIAVIEWANHVQRWDIVTSLFEQLRFFLGTRGYWQERIKYGRMALEAAEQAGDRRSAVLCQHALGWIFAKQGRYSEARNMLQSCIQSYLNLGEEMSAVWSMVTLAKAAIAQGELNLARKVIDEASDVAQETGYGKEVPGLLTVQGHIEWHSGNFEAAHALLLRALKATQREGSGISIGSRQIDLGYVLLARSRPGEAAAYLKAGLESSRQFLRQDNIAKAEFGLARVRALRGNKTEATELALRAQEQFLRMGMEKEVLEVDALLRQLDNSNEQT